jgi:predicted O-methyltransferase YrrM
MRFAKKILSDRAFFNVLETMTAAGGDDVAAHALLLSRFRPKNEALSRFYLNQRLAEWKAFTDLLKSKGFPRRILEIGTGLGGSAYSLSRIARPGSLIVTVDNSPLAREYVSIYQRPGRTRIVNVIGDSHAPETLEHIGDALGPGSVDLLYIDGDHSYEGVKADFENYKRFCRPGTLIAFHDIHPDHAHSTGTQTLSNSGEVFKFWHELKSLHPRHQEFIEAPTQDGFGIGVIEYAG